MAFSVESKPPTSVPSSASASSPDQSSTPAESESAPVYQIYREAKDTKGHSTFVDLSGFANLPYDLRALIWEATFVSRQLPFVCETRLLSDTFNPPFKRITVSGSGSSYGSSHPEYTSFLTCPKINSPAALGVNHESRQIALSRYRPWKMFNKDMKYKNVMWCPGLDIVDLQQTTTKPHTDDHVPLVKALPIFEKQFPAELVEIKNLAVPSTMWSEGQHKNIDVIWPLIDFLSLEHLVVVLDKNKERDFACNPGRGLSTVAHNAIINGEQVNWTIPEDIEKHVDIMRNHYEKFGPEYMPLRKKAIVTVVEKEEEIYGDQDLHLIIRCMPCDYLGVDSDGKLSRRVVQT